MSMTMRLAAILSGLLLATGTASAQGAGTGPVGQLCAKDLAAHCAGIPHGGTKARACLEANRAKLSSTCRNALDTTGGGRGMGRNRMAPN